jgi:archaellum biogenesis protein FlaJ (TadC family)
VKIGRQPNELKAFLNIFYLTILLALFLMVMILLEKYLIDLTQVAAHTKSAIAITVIALLLLPLIFVIKEEAAIWKRVCNIKSHLFQKFKFIRNDECNH